MADDLLNNVLKQLSVLTVDQQVSLVTQLAERVRGAKRASPRRKWREIRGMARPSLSRYLLFSSRITDFSHLRDIIYLG